jgi:hypothetical protein
VSSINPDLPVMFTRAEALVAGLSPQQVDRRLATHQWQVIRRGHYAGTALDAERQWRAEVAAVVASHERRLVLSHHDAARAWGLPRPLGAPRPLTFLSDQRPVRNSTTLKIQVAHLPEDEVMSRGRILVTSPARTVVDCARSLHARDALAIADATLHRRLVGPDDLRQSLERQSGSPHVRRARAVLELADARRETALESWSAWSFAEQDVPPPTWQATLCDGEGVFLGRTDGWWAEGVAGEADGREKYGLAALQRGGAGAAGLAAALDDERRREQRLRRAGVVIVRWTARDVLDPARSRLLARDLRSAIDRGGRFCGQVMLL